MEAQAVPREAAAGLTGTFSPRILRLASDARLVALVRDGNAAAFEAIYDRYHRPVLSFCRHMLGDPEEAADAVQHTFLAAYNAIGSSDKTILLRAWLFTIARNRCYSVLRAKREQPAAELVEPVTDGLAVQVQRREELRQLISDMSRLPDDQRAALVLAELDSLNHSEIGSALGVPTTKVKALVFQARQSLIASRDARDIDCGEIREQLATLHGGGLRRGPLRRHLRECEGCREFRSAVDRQRRSLAAILPVAPSLALKQAVLGGIPGGGATATAVAGGGLLASAAFKGIAVKGLIGGLLALIGTAGTIAAVHAWGSPRPTPSPQAGTVATSSRSPAPVLGSPVIAAGDSAGGGSSGGGAHPRDRLAVSATTSSASAASRQAVDADRDATAESIGVRHGGSLGGFAHRRSHGRAAGARGHRAAHGHGHAGLGPDRSSAARHHGHANGHLGGLRRRGRVGSPRPGRVGSSWHARGGSPRHGRYSADPQGRPLR